MGLFYGVLAIFKAGIASAILVKKQEIEISSIFKSLKSAKAQKQ
jgi:hypothetical protein